eukprot:m.232548 g.232548  ORF g.232548 m.232548 type:complete len:149 (-) comp15231_c1_seq1:376-822(-)
MLGTAHVSSATTPAVNDEMMQPGLFCSKQSFMFESFECMFANGFGWTQNEHRFRQYARSIRHVTKPLHCANKRRAQVAPTTPPSWLPSTTTTAVITYFCASQIRVTMGSMLVQYAWNISSRNCTESQMHLCAFSTESLVCHSPMLDAA